MIISGMNDEKACWPRSDLSSNDIASVQSNALDLGDQQSFEGTL